MSYEGGSLMGDKHENKNKHAKKKLTTKEKKQMNHLKLMEGSKDKNSSTEVVAFHNKDKKAA